MNVLLAEAEVDYDAMKDMDDINDEFARTDVTVVIGANDVTNPAARNEASSPIYGMPILNVDKSKSVIVLKRSMNSGFAGIDNPLFYADGTTMLFGDAKKSVSAVLRLTRFLSGTSILVESRWLPSAPVGAVSYGWHRQECPCYITKCTKPTLPHHPCRNPVKPPL